MTEKKKTEPEQMAAPDDSLQATGSYQDGPLAHARQAAADAEAEEAKDTK